MQTLTPDYWNERYLHQHTPWDMGQVSPPLKHFIDRHLMDSHTRVLIPGAGRAYEAIYLHRKGFSEVHVCDWAPAAFDWLRQQAPDFPETHLHCTDFFQLQLQVDVILEQTFFSAIEPTMRPKYARQAFELLQPGGLLAGLLFAAPFDAPGPPFGGTAAEYQGLFAPYFEIRHLAIAKDSIPPRLGHELWIEFYKPDTQSAMSD
jgi:hypothetical protein